MTTALPRPFRGVIPPLVTPLLARDRLDHAGLERLVDHVLGGGVHGLFILGTTGEGPSLSHKLRCEVIERACQHVAGRVPVLVGVTDTSFTESLELAEHAADCGAMGVVLAAPYYFPAAQAELGGYVERIADELPLPVFLYNMPSHTKLSFEPDTVRRVLHHPNIAGLKDSSAQLLYFNQIVQIAAARPEFTVLMGPEELLAQSIIVGGHGGICGGANMAPRLYVDLYHEAARGNLANAAQLHARVMRISSAIYNVGRSPSSYLRGLKCALGCLELCDDALAEPFERFGTTERETIRRHLHELGLLEPMAAISG